MRIKKFSLLHRLWRWSYRVSGNIEPDFVLPFAFAVRIIFGIPLVLFKETSIRLIWGCISLFIITAGIAYYWPGKGWETTTPLTHHGIGMNWGLITCLPLFIACLDIGGYFVALGLFYLAWWVFCVGWMIDGVLELWQNKKNQIFLPIIFDD